MAEHGPLLTRIGWLQLAFSLGGGGDRALTERPLSGSGSKTFISTNGMRSVQTVEMYECGSVGARGSRLGLTGTRFPDTGFTD